MAGSMADTELMATTSSACEQVLKHRQPIATPVSSSHSQTRQFGLVPFQQDINLRTLGRYVKQGITVCFPPTCFQKPFHGAFSSMFDCARACANQLYLI